MKPCSNKFNVTVSVDGHGLQYEVVWTHMLPERLSVGSQGLGVSVFDEPNHLLDTPAGRVLTGRTLALSAVWHRTVSWVAQGNKEVE